ALMLHTEPWNKNGVYPVASSFPRKAWLVPFCGNDDFCYILQDIINLTAIRPGDDDMLFPCGLDHGIGSVRVWRCHFFLKEPCLIYPAYLDLTISGFLFLILRVISRNTGSIGYPLGTLRPLSGNRLAQFQESLEILRRATDCIANSPEADSNKPRRVVEESSKSEL